MGALSDLPAELISHIVDYLHDDGKALKASALVSRIFVARSQVHLFERVALWIPDHGSGANAGGNTYVLQTYISSDPDGLLSHTRSLLLGYLTLPQHLEEIYDHWMAFKNVEELQARLFTTHFVQDPMLLSRYFSHFRSTLRYLRLETWLENPKDLIAFVAFFPFLEEVSIETLSHDPPSLPDSKSEGLDPGLLSPLRGSLVLRKFQHENDFLVELAKVRVRYHTLSIWNGTVWTGLQELIIACGPTLRVLNLTCEACESFFLFDFERCWITWFQVWIGSVSEMYRDLPMNFTRCTRLTEITLPLPLNFSLILDRYSTLISDISSPHLQKITLVLEKNQPSPIDIEMVMEMLLDEVWRTFEDALLGVSSRSRNVLEVVMALSSIDHARRTPDCATFLPRFREVGHVTFEFPWMVYAPLRSAQISLY